MSQSPKSQNPTSQSSTSRNRRTRTGWIGRPHRHHWVADTRDQDFSAGRLMRGYRAS